MEIDSDTTIIGVLFGIGVALLLTALLAFGDGQIGVGLPALVGAVIGLGIVLADELNRRFRLR